MSHEHRARQSMGNPYIESFHGKFRDECLNMHVFTDGRHAQEVVEVWRITAQSILNYMTPSPIRSTLVPLRSAYGISTLRQYPRAKTRPRIQGKPSHSGWYIVHGKSGAQPSRRIFGV